MHYTEEPSFLFYSSIWEEGKVMKYKHRTISGELGWSERHRGVHWDMASTSPKHLCYRPWGLSVLQTHCVTSCFFPWVPDYILKILSHLSKHLISRTFRSKSSGTTVFSCKWKITSRTGEGSSTLLCKRKRCLRVQFRSSAWEVGVQFTQFNLPPEAELLSQLIWGFTLLINLGFQRSICT